MARTVAVLLVSTALSGCSVGVAEPGRAAAAGPTTPDRPAATTPTSRAPIPEYAVVDGTGQQYLDPGGRFGITIPLGWQLWRIRVNGGDVTLRDDLPSWDPDFPSEVSIHVRPRDVASLAPAVADERSRVRLSRSRVTLDEPFVLADGVAGHLLGTEGTRDGHGVRSLRLITVDRLSVITVEAGTLADEWDVHEPGYYAVLHSLIASNLST